MKRRALFALAAAAAVTLAGCTTAASPPTSSAAATKATLGLSYIPDVQFSPAYVAADDGLFAAAGADVTLRHHGASEGLFTALTAGQEDFVVAGGDEMLQAASAGADLVAVSAYYAAYPVVIIVPASSGIATLADLKGHSIGVPGRYGESWFGLKVALDTAGLTEADVAIQEIGYTGQAAIATGKVDAIVGFSNNDAVSLNGAGTPVRTLAVADNPPLVSISLVTTKAYAAAHPAAVKAVVKGLLGGLQAVVADPAKGVDASVSRIPTLSTQAAKDAARATLDATIKLIAPSGGTVSGKLDAQQWAAMAAFMQAKGLLQGAVDPATAMSDDFLP